LLPATHLAFEGFCKDSWRAVAVSLERGEHVAIKDEPVVASVEKAAPSVVNISTVQVVQDQFLHIHPVSGLGSGFILSDHGYIVTNRHVVADARRIVVTFQDGRKVPGAVRGLDRTTDIAVVKVDSTGLGAALLGDSDAVRVGQQVIAIGNPFGFLLGGPTVTVGYISAVHRQIESEQQLFEDLIQTDAAINPGNSGGPLVDLEARVIGINTAAIPFAQGIGFAVPVNVVRRVTDEIVVNGRVIRPWLGLAGTNLTEENAEYYGVSSARGVLVVGVGRGSPAAGAGLQRGDVITGIEGRAVRGGVRELTQSVLARKPGDAVELRVLREGREGTLRITLREAPSE
jgi:serine protease Do